MRESKQSVAVSLFLVVYMAYYEVWATFRVNSSTSSDLCLTWIFLPQRVWLTKNPSQVCQWVEFSFNFRYSQAVNQNSHHTDKIIMYSLEKFSFNYLRKKSHIFVIYKIDFDDMMTSLGTISTGALYPQNQTYLHTP